MNSTWPVVILIYLYVKFSTDWGPKWMKNREPFQIDRLVQIYDAFQVIANAYVCQQVIDNLKPKNVHKWLNFFILILKCSFWHTPGCGITIGDVSPSTIHWILGLWGWITKCHFHVHELIRQFFFYHRSRRYAIIFTCWNYWIF